MKYAVALLVTAPLLFFTSIGNARNVSAEKIYEAAVENQRSQAQSEWERARQNRIAALTPRAMILVRENYGIDSSKFSITQSPDGVVILVGPREVCKYAPARSGCIRCGTGREEARDTDEKINCAQRVK